MPDGGISGSSPLRLRAAVRVIISVGSLGGRGGGVWLKKIPKTPGVLLSNIFLTTVFGVVPGVLYVPGGPSMLTPSLHPARADVQRPASCIKVSQTSFNRIRMGDILR
jgi:hypothetical protein